MGHLSRNVKIITMGVIIRFEDFQMPDPHRSSNPDMNEETTGGLDGVSDERIIDAWSRAIGGNQPDMEQMKSDLLQLMSRDGLTFEEIEEELDKNPVEAEVTDQELEELEPGEDEVEEKQLTDKAQDYVSMKIAKLKDEGYDDAQATAIAFSMARKRGFDVGKNPNEAETSDYKAPTHVVEPYDEEDEKKIKKVMESRRLVSFQDFSVNENHPRAGKPAGLSVEETKAVAERLAEAMTKSYKETFTVNPGVEEDSFDLDMDGEAYDGGSYDIYDDGSVINVAIPSKPNYGHYSSTVEEFMKTIKEIQKYNNDKWQGFLGDTN